MAYTDKCRGCSASVLVAPEDIKKMIEEIVDSGNFDLVAEDVYGVRLQRCSGCEFLQYGTTCMQCGCIVQIRALLTEKDCPHPQNTKWE